MHFLIIADGGASTAISAAEHTSKITYDICSAALRQGSFYYQVSLPHFSDESFMKESVTRYKMYLFLKKENKTPLVPCYDFDLVWHTHQVHPYAYQRDTTSILGYVLNHDDSMTDRSVGSKLNNANKLTQRLWSTRFHVPFTRPGAMFRGNDPYWCLQKITTTVQRSLLVPNEMEMEFDSMKVMI